MAKNNKNFDESFWVNIFLSILLIIGSIFFYFQDIGEINTATSVRNKIVKFLLISTDQIGGKWFLSSLLLIGGIYLLYVTFKKK